jgi:CMP-N,N'-diacetyllegionaminic acid synthase
MGKKRIAAIVIVRGGSKGIPGKNLIPFCGKPLLQWTLEQLKEVLDPKSIWVVSDSKPILHLALHMGCLPIIEPPEIATDTSTSESAWLHALTNIEGQDNFVDTVLAVQATSPLREPEDFREALKLFETCHYDSLFSASPAKDICLWHLEAKKFVCDSYDRANPNRRRQVTFGDRWIENGSFYIFKPEVLRQTGTRFGGHIGIYPMEYWKMFEIDEPRDLALCQVLMQAHLDGRL